MTGDYAPQYQKPCVLLDVADQGLPVDFVISFACDIGALFYEHPSEDPLFVIEFPDRPQELYTGEALRRTAFFGQPTN